MANFKLKWFVASSSIRKLCDNLQINVTRLKRMFPVIYSKILCNTDWIYSTKVRHRWHKYKYPIINRWGKNHTLKESLLILTSLSSDKANLLLIICLIYYAKKHCYSRSRKTKGIPALLNCRNVYVLPHATTPSPLSRYQIHRNV